jgi:competence CoiA-like predicted nuclease
VYPDISFCLNGRWYVAVELQVSDIAISTIQRRVEAYTKRDVALLWVLPSNDGLIQGALYQSTHWERYLHALCRRKLYYWMHDETLQPVTYRDVTTTGEDYQWYENQAEWLLAGQPQRSKTRKRIELHPLVKITDLVPVLFPAWDGMSMSLPEARLWTIKPGGAPLP